MTEQARITDREPKADRYKIERQLRITLRVDPGIPFEAQAGRAILRFELARKRLVLSVEPKRAGEHPEPQVEQELESSSKGQQ